MALSFNEKGFVFAPFDWQDNAVLIRADKVSTSSFEANIGLVGEVDELSETGKQPFLKLVQKGVTQIKQGELKKVVLSRKIDLEFHQSPLEVFQRLIENYAKAFCYLFHHPKVGIWCGATPETLVYITKGELKTMSLAATLPYLEGTQPKWGSKEIEEQEMVSGYILEQLSEIANGLKMEAVKSSKAGNLWHLKSEIKGKLQSSASLKDVVKALHPTPAVCGIPTKEAQQFIQEQEGYARTFYTGFLGELNLEETTSASLFVNLRCMEIKPGKASIFVGGGITSASDTEKEWTETQNKSKTLLNILQFVSH
ncbi:isochorismate synthase [Flagellimonas algicola]|uniref:isochorismate synthase n=1 Tax=Flagellimonas algicola TaxID=2583815 RepID=A0ABY2WT24_9FLAO|nr:isochorismate synthase [Allomuricauda algicola]